MSLTLKFLFYLKFQKLQFSFNYFLYPDFFNYFIFLIMLNKIHLKFKIISGIILIYLK